MPLLVDEATRQLDICNACRYCEGLCAVFPALSRRTVLSAGDVSQLASLCHDCRACYDACMYTAPHEFDLNVPAVLTEVRLADYQRYGGLPGCPGCCAAGPACSAGAVASAALFVGVAAAHAGWSGLVATHDGAASPYRPDPGRRAGRPDAGRPSVYAAARRRPGRPELLGPPPAAATSRSARPTCCGPPGTPSPCAICAAAAASCYYPDDDQPSPPPLPAPAHRGRVRPVRRLDRRRRRPAAPPRPAAALRLAVRPGHLGRRRRPRPAGRLRRPAAAQGPFLGGDQHRPDDGEGLRAARPP